MSGEKREGVARRATSLPLFPLRTVLFPGGLLPLKVFEHRYVEMTKACLREERPFGVCLILEGDEVAQPDAQAPKIASVGTLARITVVDMPQLGILHVATVGEGRFEVHRYASDPLGLVIGEVTPIPDEPQMPLAESQARLSKLLALIATKLGPDSFPSKTHYDDATWVGHRLAELLPLPLAVKQRMLEVSDANVRLGALTQYLERQGLLQAL
jgi:Lon protease-like protein